MWLKALISIFFGIIGLAIGSLINVLAFRFDLETCRTNAKGRSHCLHCNKNLAWFELIPIFSFLFLRGRCRSCNKKISWQYPLIELATALIFFGIVWRIFSLDFFSYYFFSGGFRIWPVLTVLFWLFFSGILILLSIIDLRHKILPDKIVFSGIIGAAIFVFLEFFFSLIRNSGFPKCGFDFLGGYFNLFDCRLTILGSAFLGVLTTAGFLFCLYFFSRGRAIGFGDVKLAVFIGLILGFWPGILSLIISFVLGALICLFMLAFKKAKFRQSVPFGPFLTAGVFCVIFFGERIINWYFSIFNIW